MLHEKLTIGAEFMGGSDYYQKNIPDCIASNLNPVFELRPYQLEALGRFKYYLEDYAARPQNAPLQTLFHMATGSGKTLKTYCWNLLPRWVKPMNILLKNIAIKLFLTIRSSRFG